MKQAVLQFVPHPSLIGLICAIILGLLLFLYLIRKHFRSKKPRLPLALNFLRSPGQSLLKELAYLNQKIMSCFVFLIVIPVYTYAAYVSYLYFGKKPFAVTDMLLVSLLPLVLICFSLHQMTRYMGQRRRLQLGYDGRVAVGQALMQLHREGYAVFHDFPADKFNIDHVVVGSKGGFVIATATRSKPTGENRLQDATVEYNGRVLRFPKGTDMDIVEQANRQADWLSEWLSNAIGEPVVVRGIVALPGWFVKRTSAEGIPVVNPKQFGSLFQYIQPRRLTPETIDRVVHQLEQKCRNIESIESVSAV